MSFVKQIFPNFDAAIATCGPAYHDADIADVIAYKTGIPVKQDDLTPEQASNSILTVSLAALETTGRPLTVLDFGGGCGFHYFRVVPVIQRTPLHWAIIETPTMADRARKLAHGRFEVFTEIDAAASALGQIDLVHASSALQYVADPIASLTKLAVLGARYFAVLRFPLWHGPTVVGVMSSELIHNGWGPMPPDIENREVKYPVTFINIVDVERVLSDYRLLMAMESPSANYDVQGHLARGVSMIFRRK